MDIPNLNYIKELSDGNEEFEAHLITVLKKELPLEIEEFNKNIQQNILLEAAQDVHKIKHKISILNMTESFAVAEKFENNLKNNQLELQENFVEILKKMTTFLSQL
jgi:HPt (histidine-containing phosphotransfer) domain-containing protein